MLFNFGTRTLIAGVAVLFPTTAAAEQPNDPPTRAELAQQDADRMAESESRIKTWFADPQIVALKARADGGDARAQVRFGDRIRDDLRTEIWMRERMQSNMLKYYAMAMGQDHGPAFARFGKLNEVSTGSGDNYTARDLGKAMAFYERGAALRDRESIAGYMRVAFNTKYCSFCRDRGDLGFDVEKTVAAGLGKKNRGELKSIYRDEKRASIEKAVDFASAGRLRPGDEASHMLAKAYLDGIKVPDQGVGMPEFSNTNDQEQIRKELAAAEADEWLLEPNYDNALSILTELSGRGDLRASRELAQQYLYATSSKFGVIPQDFDKYKFYMNRAVDEGSILAAYSLGYELLSGKTLPANHTQGFEYMAKAAIAGFAPAELSAAYAYREGRGVEQNDKFALMMFKRAADHGELKGAEQAAAMYRAGRGTDSGRAEIPNAVAYEKKAENIKSLNPLMADAVTRAHREQFE